jgi:hypothetical protein
MQCASGRDIVAPAVGGTRHHLSFEAAAARRRDKRPNVTSLTHAQRLADEFRDCPITRTLLKPRMVGVVEAVLRTTEVVREAGEGCASLVGQLSAGNDQAEESQRPQAPLCRIEHSAAPDLLSLYGRIPRV